MPAAAAIVTVEGRINSKVIRALDNRCLIIFQCRTKSSPAAPQTTTSRQHLFAAGNTQKRPTTRGRVERLVVCWPPLTSSAEDPPVVPKP